MEDLKTLTSHIAKVGEKLGTHLIREKKLMKIIEDQRKAVKL